MDCIIETLLEYEWTEFKVHRMVRVIDQHISTKKWLPQIVIKVNYEDGIARTFKTYVGRNLCGSYTVYNCEGTLFIKNDFVNNEVHGRYTEWWGDGTLWMESDYYRGTRHGLTTVYRRSGDIFNQVKYVNGKIERVSCDSLH